MIEVSLLKRMEALEDRVTFLEAQASRCINESPPYVFEELGDRQCQGCDKSFLGKFKQTHCSAECWSTDVKGKAEKYKLGPREGWQETGRHG